MALTPLAGPEREALLAALPGWRIERDALVRAWRFPTFSSAIAFLADCAEDIERLDHHPDWRNCYDRVWVRLTTHAAGDRLTAKDGELAKLLQWRASAFGAVDAHDP